VGPTALGEQGGELGYGGFGKITSSIAVKFDLYSNAGEGPNSTGLYTNGADPTIPATTLGGGVDLHSGHVFKAHMTYDGTTLTMTITDQTTPANTFTTSWPINIPATVGGSTAYVGFTGGTGGGTATQEILNWKYSAGTTTVTPDFSVSVSPSSQTVTPGNSTTYTVTIGALNGFTGTVTLSASGLPTGASASFAPATITASGSSTMTVTTGSTTPTGTSTLTVTGTSGNLTHSATTAINVQSSSGGGGINFGSGFSTTGLQFNGSATLNGTRLQITNTTTTGQAGSAFWTQKVNVGTFTNDFVFQLTNPVADGMTFTIQGVGPTALGEQGGELGYGGFGKITPSVAVKFDLYSNAGEGPNSTGLYTNGADPTIPATTLGGGVDLHSGHIFKAHMTYDGTTLTMTITDQTTPANTFTTSWPINIPATVGGSTAYVGFTGGTGGGTATQEILNWTYK